jgi:hypothetical protein
MQASKVFIVFTYENENIEVLSNVGHVLSMAHNYLKFDFLKKTLHYNRQMVLVTFVHFIHIST